MSLRAQLTARLRALRCQEGIIEERARDPNSMWMTAVEMLDDDTFLGAENSHNLLVVRKNGDAATDEERQRLDIVGEFHLGDFVNRFRRGSLVMRLPDSDLATVPTILFATIHGVIGVIASLPAEQYAFLARLQEALCTTVRGVGGFSWAEWRNFGNERRNADVRNFIDGDLIECVGERQARVRVQRLMLMCARAALQVLSRLEAQPRGRGGCAHGALCRRAHQARGGPNAPALSNAAPALQLQQTAFRPVPYLRVRPAPPALRCPRNATAGQGYCLLRRGPRCRHAMHARRAHRIRPSLRNPKSPSILNRSRSLRAASAGPRARARLADGGRGRRGRRCALGRHAA